MQSRFHCLWSDAEVGRGVLGAHLLNVAQHEDETESLRKRIHRTFEQFADFALRGGAFGI